MKILSGESYEVADRTNSSRLCDTVATYDEAIGAMELAKKNDKANGYPPIDYIIVKTIWTNVFSEDGTFYSHTEQCVRIEP